LKSKVWAVATVPEACGGKRLGSSSSGSKAFCC